MPMDVILGEDGDVSAAAGDDAGRGKGVAQGGVGKGQAAARSEDADVPAIGGADVAGAGVDVARSAGFVLPEFAEECVDGGVGGVVVSGFGVVAAGIAEDEIEDIDRDFSLLLGSEVGEDEIGVDFLEVGGAFGGVDEFVDEGGDVQIARGKG